MLGQWLGVIMFRDEEGAYVDVLSPIEQVVLVMMSRVMMMRPLF
jgi:hypothetical protein